MFALPFFCYNSAGAHCNRLPITGILCLRYMNLLKKHLYISLVRRMKKLIIIFFAVAWIIVAGYPLSFSSEIDKGFGQDRTHDCPSEYEALLAGAEKGNPADEYRLSLMYYNGSGVRQDYREAFRWCKRAADQGYAQVQVNVGAMFYKGQGVSRDLRRLSAGSDSRRIEAMKRPVSTSSSCIIWGAE